jgi:antitoxin HicB
MPAMKMSKRTYTLSIEKHPDGYLAYFPALEGCNTWGRTYEEAVRHAEEALALYLETLDELGKAVPEERGINQPVSLGVTVRVPVIA